VKDNLKETPKEVVTDGGYVSKDTIVAMKQRAIEYIAPCVDEAGKGQSSYDQARRERRVSKFPVCL
jgi:hypothetical protein